MRFARNRLAVLFAVVGMGMTVVSPMAVSLMTAPPAQAQTVDVTLCDVKDLAGLQHCVPILQAIVNATQQFLNSLPAFIRLEYKEAISAIQTELNAIKAEIAILQKDEQILKSGGKITQPPNTGQCSAPPGFVCITSP